MRVAYIYLLIYVSSYTALLILQYFCNLYHAYAIFYECSNMVMYLIVFIFIIVFFMSMYDCVERI